MIDLSIIIVSWNTRELLDDCLGSIFQKSSGYELEVIVVDNHSTDGSPELLDDKYPNIRLVKNEENVGFAQANNQGFRMCAGRYIMLLNPDTVLLDGALSILIRFMDNHPDAGAAGPRLLNPDHSLQTSCYPVPTLSREFWRLFHLDRFYSYGSYPMASWDLDAPRSVDVIQGACIILRKEAVDEIGFLDEDYFIYTEEVDLCYRLLCANWGIYWLAQAEVVHYGEQSTKQLAAEMFLYLYQSKMIFFKKHYGEISLSVYKLILVSAAITRILMAPLALIEEPEVRHRHLRLAKNYRNLLWNIPRM